MYTKTKKVIQKEVEETHKFCDLCGQEVPFGLACSRATCELCRADLCEDCIGHESESYGDYRTVWCKVCWDIGEPYRKKIEDLKDECDHVRDAWKQASIERQPNRGRDE